MRLREIERGKGGRVRGREGGRERGAIEKDREDGGRERQVGIEVGREGEGGRER